MRVRLFRGMGAGDVVLLVLLLVAVAASVAGRWQPAAGATAAVEVDGRAVQTLNLQQPARASIRGVRGLVVVEVREGRTAVVAAECPNHVCVRTGWRSRTGDVIVCVPNRVIVRILGGEKEGVRARTG